MASMRSFGISSVIGMPATVEYRGKGRRYLHETLIPYAADGRVYSAVVVFGRDHTELKLREQEVASQQQQLTVSEALKSAIQNKNLSIDDVENFVGTKR